MEILVRELSDLHDQGKDIVLVSSGAIAVGSRVMGIDRKPNSVSEKQACAAIGQARLMMIYQKLFSEYNQTAAQVLMTKNTMVNNLNRQNAKNTFKELLHMGAIPIVNENDTISTYEIEFGDDDNLSAVVAALIGADLLILLSDIDGLFTDDPNTNPDARFIEVVETIDDTLLDMGKSSTGSNVGTGGMATKLRCYDSNQCRSGYGDCQRKGLPHYSQDNVRPQSRHLISGQCQRRILSDRLYRKIIVKGEHSKLWIQ